MLDRLDAGLHRERRFVAEASHELRTPLALLKLELDLALARPRSPEELTAAIRSAGEEVDRLTRLSEDLLLLAVSDDRRLQLDLSDIAAHPIDRHVPIRVADHGRALPAAGDRARAFERFSRDSASRSRGGRGLALPIVQAIVAEHDGTVTFADRADAQGVVVTVEIPGRRTA